MNIRPWIGVVLVAGFCATTTDAQVIVDPGRPLFPDSGNPAIRVPYPNGGTNCHNTLADAGARVVLRAIDRCPDKFIGSWPAYLAYAREAVIGIAVPGAPEAVGALALEKVGENAFFCISESLIDESSATEEDRAFLKALLVEVKENLDRADLARKSLGRFSQSLVDKGIAPNLSPGEAEAFRRTLDASLLERYEGGRSDLDLVAAGEARKDTPGNRARAASERADQLSRECRYADAVSALQEAVNANLEVLSDLRGEVSRAKHYRYCIERDARLQQRNALDPVSPFLRHALDSADDDVRTAERADAEQTAAIGVMAEDRRRMQARVNDVEILKERATRQLQLAQTATGNCDFGRAESALRAIDQETLDCAVLIDAERQQRDAVRSQMQALQTQLGELEAEHSRAIALPFAELASCGELTVFADTLDGLQGGCREFANIESKVAALHNRAEACATFRATSGTQSSAGINQPPPPGTLSGTPTISESRYDDHGNGAFTRSDFSATASKWERYNPTEMIRAIVQWQYDGVPGSLSPGQTVTIRVHGGVTAENPPGISAGLVLSGVVAVYGDVTVKTAQQADRQHPEGVYEFTVYPNPQSVEIHLGGHPAGTGTIWKYKKP